MKAFNEQSAVQFLKDVRRPLLSLHKSIIDHERAAYEKAHGPVTPAAFLQQLISGADFRWIAPLSTAIANIDELLDDEKITADNRIAGAQAIATLFESGAPDNAFRKRYLVLLQESPAILHEHGRVVQALRDVE
ncbi:hypothetical protein [Edaphobacter sp. 12200R-103]|jgi:hypothetical protein|uniref:hypothetical protein n=1 Tax=Edaphobacter sp. 12200R-103 TaxID=2703788 RepID=UPI00138CF5CE|nr:hypothetical protein [Edaphobacter sp. 12200R-103]QHS52454.1 hypothetical protein GWR55_12490 [Edaphobacter sp. 12200R-103]